MSTRWPCPRLIKRTELSKGLDSLTKDRKIAGPFILSRRGGGIGLGFREAFQGLRYESGTGWEDDNLLPCAVGKKANVRGMKYPV
jgi:hypothetical protein